MKSKFVRRHKIPLLLLSLLVLFGVLLCVYVYMNQTRWATYVNDQVSFTFDYPDSWRIEKKIEYSNLDLPPKPSVRVELNAFNKTNGKHVSKLVYWDGPVAAVGYSCMGQGNEGCAYIDNPLVESFYSTEPYNVWKSMNYSYTFTRYNKTDVNSEILNRVLKSISIENRTMLREDVSNRCTNGSTTLAARRIEERWVPDDQVDTYIEQVKRDNRCILKDEGPELY